MSKKDYEALARAIARTPANNSEEYGMKRRLTLELAHELARDNSRFNHERFYSAAGIVS